MADDDSYIKEIVGDNLKYIREKRGLTQEKLGDLANVSSRTILNIENRTVFPKPTTIGQLSRALDISPAELFLTKEERNASGKGMEGVELMIHKQEIERIRTAINRILDGVE